MTDTRTETDSFGPIEVPADCYWGAQTQRSLGNFPFGERERMPIRLVHAQAIVKQAAARVNRKHGLDGKLADAMESARPRRSSPVITTTSSRSPSGRPAAAPRPT